MTLTSKSLYSFTANQYHLPCLAHVINLSIMEFMNVITKIAHIKTTTIWEFDPTLPRNQVLGSSLDVVIHTLSIKIQASGQHIMYFEHLQKECGVAVPLRILLHSNVCWGTADGMLAQSYNLHRVSSYSIS